jgi:hypothetical protein
MDVSCLIRLNICAFNYRSFRLLPLLLVCCHFWDVAHVRFIHWWPCRKKKLETLAQTGDRAIVEISVSSLYLSLFFFDVRKHLRCAVNCFRCRNKLNFIHNPLAGYWTPFYFASNYILIYWRFFLSHSLILAWNAHYSLQIFFALRSEMTMSFFPI